VDSQNLTLAVLLPVKRPGICTGGWVGPQDRTGQMWKISPPTWIRSSDRPACSERLYRLSYPYFATDYIIQSQEKRILVYRKFNFGEQHFTYGARCWWRSWLRHCATSRKAAGLFLDGVNGIFHLHNPSGRTIVLGLTQPLTEMSTRNVSWGVWTAGA